MTPACFNGTQVAVIKYPASLHWRHNDHDRVSNHQPHGCLLNRLFRRRSKKTSKLRVTGLCVGNSPGPVNSPHKGPVTRKMFSFDDVIMMMSDIRYIWRTAVHTAPHESTWERAWWQLHPLTMMTSPDGNIFRVTGSLCGEFTGHRWIPRTKASDAKLWSFLWSAPWINGWVNNREAGDHRARYDITVILHYICRVCLEKAIVK